MTAIDIMAGKLRRELIIRGVISVPSVDVCAEIIRNVIDHASDVAKECDRPPSKEAPPPK